MRAATSITAVLTIVGPAQVVDGDTLRLGGERVRLYGVDAPERDQLCGVASCGDVAKLQLTQFIADRPVTCEGSKRDRYRRLLATCTVGGRDLGSWMVRRGYAMAYVRYSSRYLTAETKARRERAGLWKDGFEVPENWRRR